MYNGNLESSYFRKSKPIRSETKSARCKFSKINFKDHVNEANLFAQGIEKNIIPSYVNDIFTRLEIILGLNLSGHTNTLTEAAYLIDEL